jgi:hypothetical protein
VSAVFGQIAYDVTAGMELALALRYDSEKRSVDNNVPTGAQAFAQTPLFGPGPTAPFINPAYTVNPSLATSGIPDRDETFEQLQPKVSLNWKFADGLGCVRVVRLWIPQRRLQLHGQQRDDPDFPRRAALRRAGRNDHDDAVARHAGHQLRRLQEGSREGGGDRLEGGAARSNAVAESRRVSHEVETCRSSTSSRVRSACCAS